MHREESGDDILVLFQPHTQYESTCKNDSSVYATNATRLMRP